MEWTGRSRPSLIVRAATVRIQAPEAALDAQQRQLAVDDSRFCIAALPNGYVYRLALTRRVIMGWCGEKSLVTVEPAPWTALLVEAEADWIDLPPLPRDAWRRGKVGPAGVQCALPGAHGRGRQGPSRAMAKKRPQLSRRQVNIQVTIVSLC